MTTQLTTAERDRLLSMPAGPELDRLACEAIGIMFDEGFRSFEYRPRKISADRETIFLVVDAMEREGYSVELMRFHSDDVNEFCDWIAAFHKLQTLQCESIIAETVSLAVVRAAMAALPVVDANKIEPSGEDTEKRTIQ